MYGICHKRLDPLVGCKWLWRHPVWSFLNLAAPGTLFYISISSVGKPHVYPPRLTELKKNRLFFWMTLHDCPFSLRHLSTPALFLSSPLSRSPCLYFSSRPMLSRPHPSDFVAAHQYWPHSPELMRAIRPALCTLACLYHRADEINSPGSALRKPIFALWERTHHSKWPSFEWAVHRKLLSYCFYYMVSA